MRYIRVETKYKLIFNERNCFTVTASEALTRKIKFRNIDTVKKKDFWFISHCKIFRTRAEKSNDR